MMKKKITNTDRNNALHTLFIEHKIDKIFYLLQQYLWPFYGYQFCLILLFSLK